MASDQNAAPDARYLPPEVRREQILASAAELAIADGLENTSIAKVAAAAGVAKGSIYLHFRSRQELIAQLQAQLWSKMNETPRSLTTATDLNWASRLDAVVEHWIRFEFENHELYHAVFHAVATADEPWDEARRLLGQLVQGGVAAGEFDLEDLQTETVVEFLLHAYAGPCLHHADIESAIVDTQKLFRRAVGALN
jgi:TetR/AcrR family transcriptional regulator, transcriptional repressor for nem operon